MCGNPSGGSCDIPELDISDAACGANGMCTGPVTPPSGYSPGACFNFPQGSGFVYYGGTTCGTQSMMNMSCDSGSSACNVSASVGPATVSGSSCAPSAPNPMLQPVTWGSAGLACGGPTPGTGCGATDTCLPVPGGPFHSGVCIMASGEMTCPPGQFTDQHVFYSGTDDQRGCSQCSCGSPTGDSCTVTWSLYNSSSNPPACSTQVLTVASGQCTAFSGNPDVVAAKAQVTVPPHGGSCTPIDGTPTGTAKPTGATTFCCIP